MSSHYLQVVAPVQIVQVVLPVVTAAAVERVVPVQLAVLAVIVELAALAAVAVLAAAANRQVGLTSQCSVDNASKCANEDIEPMLDNRPDVLLV